MDCWADALLHACAHVLRRLIAFDAVPAHTHKHGGDVLHAEFDGALCTACHWAFAQEAVFEGFVERLAALFPGQHLQVRLDRSCQLRVAPVRFVFRNVHTTAEGRKPSDDTE